jgi:hypothetical protein
LRTLSIGAIFLPHNLLVCVVLKPHSYFLALQYAFGIYSIFSVLESAMSLWSHFLSLKKGIKNQDLSWMLVSHTYNPSYFGGRDQEGCGLRPAQANSS